MLRPVRKFRDPDCDFEATIADGGSRHRGPAVKQRSLTESSTNVVASKLDSVKPVSPDAPAPAPTVAAPVAPSPLVPTNPPSAPASLIDVPEYCDALFGPNHPEYLLPGQAVRPAPTLGPVYPLRLKRYWKIFTFFMLLLHAFLLCYKCVMPTPKMDLRFTIERLEAEGWTPLAVMALCFIEVIIAGALHIWPIFASFTAWWFIATSEYFDENLYRFVGEWSNFWAELPFIRWLFLPILWLIGFIHNCLASVFWTRYRQTDFATDVQYYSEQYHLDRHILASVALRNSHPKPSPAFLQSVRNQAYGELLDTKRFTACECARQSAVISRLIYSGFFSTSLLNPLLHSLDKKARKQTRVVQSEVFTD